MIEMKEWDGFEGRLWKEEINVRQFIQDNYTPYDGDESFLADPTDATNKLWDALQKLQKEERAKGGVLDMETEVVTGITAYGPGYIDESLKDLEQIVGLQTDKPLKRAFMPYGSQSESRRDHRKGEAGCCPPHCGCRSKGKRDRGCCRRERREFKKEGGIGNGIECPAGDCCAETVGDRFDFR